MTLKTLYARAVCSVILWGLSGMSYVAWGAEKSYWVAEQLISADGKVAAFTMEPITDQTQRLAVQLLEPLLSETHQKRILLPQGTRLLCRARGYAVAQGKLLVTCHSAIVPGHSSILPLGNAYLSQTGDKVGLSVAKPAQKQFVFPQGEKVFIVFDSQSLLHQPSGD